ncbi:hypothetical protein LAZ40_06885 [Cereibacter sphaeroides]|uniref:hypothetical protein n=1 Tax=Cereibacter sphaeroides TaxID=1063 RepID=UPI001F40AB44|nr:hypothetical protein [Cereibacter sphaeroides]MCE6958772.1 hypothetical protein [Cereibacter sphaeroides]
MRMDRIDAIVTALDSHIGHQVEYCERHRDAGDAYVHLPRESGFAWGEGAARLAAWVEAEGIDDRGLDASRLAGIALDHFRMVSGSIHATSPEEGFCIDRFPVGEIEIQVRREAFDAEATLEEWEEAKRRAAAVFRADLGYVISDRVWRAMIDADKLREEIRLAAHPELEPELDF